METIKISLDVLSADELATYQPEARYWAVRTLWVPNTSIDAPPRLFVLRISFQNQSSAKVDLPFSNQSHQAELLGLTIVDDAGQKVEPTGNLHIRLKPGVRKTQEIQAGQSFVYDLIGEICGDLLVFPGAKYPLPRRGAYRIRFAYQGRQTNEVVVQL